MFSFVSIKLKKTLESAAWNFIFVQQCKAINKTIPTKKRSPSENYINFRQVKSFFNAFCSKWILRCNILLHKIRKCINYPETIRSRERKKCIFSLLCKYTFPCVRHLLTFLSHYFTFYQRFRLVKTVLLGQYSAIVLSYMLC